jgi:FkbM family methyltransferase
MKATIKTAFLKTMPAPVVQWAKRRHYARQLDTVDKTREPEMEIIADLVSSGDTVADVGANFGVYTKLLSTLVGDGGSVHSFEPIPLTFGLLSSNRAHLGPATLHLHQLAVSDEDTEVAMEIPLYETGTEAFYRSHIVKGSEANVDNPVVQVQCRRLDAILPDAGVFSFLKVDVEGHELACFRGALELVRRDHPALFVEVSGSPDEADSDAHVLLAMLTSEGYEVWVYEEGRMRPRRAGDNFVNYFFLTKEHVEKLANKGKVGT